MSYQAGNDKMVRNRNRRERRARERRIADLKAVMGTPEGRRVVWGFLSEAGVFRTSFTQPNGLVVAFNEGGRNLGLRLLDELQQHCLDELHLAEAEAMRHAKHEAQVERALVQEELGPISEQEDPDA